jgi:integrase
MRTTSEQRFYANKDISEVNKRYVTEYYKTHNVAESTKGKDYSYFPYFLKGIKDIKREIRHNGKIAERFDNLHKKLSASSYKICLDVSKPFFRWINGNVLPTSYSYIKKLTDKEKKTMARVNKPGYKTLSWQDGLKIIEVTNSIQYKAMVMTQLDGGFRPNELIQLDYGDCKKDNKFIICHVKESKTGEKRDVVIYNAASYLNRWLQMHPTKNPKDPLWMMENKNMSSIFRAGERNTRITYDGMRQTLRRLGIRAGVGAINPYMLRHSAVTITKQERMGAELASERFGHNITYYINVYGKLTDEQKVNRFKTYYGGAMKKEAAKPQNQLCPICDTINEPSNKVCDKCRSPLTLTAAIDLDKGKETEMLRLAAELKAVRVQQMKDAQRLTEALNAVHSFAKEKGIRLSSWRDDSGDSGKIQ